MFNEIPNYNPEEFKCGLFLMTAAVYQCTQPYIYTRYQKTLREINGFNNIERFMKWKLKADNEVMEIYKQRINFVKSDIVSAWCDCSAMHHNQYSLVKNITKINKSLKEEALKKIYTTKYLTN